MKTIIKQVNMIMYDELCEKEMLDKLLSKVWDVATYEWAREKFLDLIALDRNFRDYIADRYISWEEGEHYRKGSADFRPFEVAFDKMALEKAFELEQNMFTRIL